MPIDAAAAKSVFLAALERQDPSERAKFLDETCAGDSELRDRVEALLKGHDSGSFPDYLVDAAPAFDVTQSVVNTPNDATQTSTGGTFGEASLGFLAPPANPGNLGRLDNYEVQSVLGQGGMGIVLKAFDESLDRIVAIKVLGSQYAANGTARKRFIREAKAVAAVAHEHVVHVYAVNERVPYLVMQYIKGVSLQDRIDKSGPLELKEILRIGMQIAYGLSAAHAQGIVHRDIKPANILLENGIERVKLTDFGLARAVDDASVTQSGVIAGTPMYMSPEQARGEQVDPRSDLFSLGSVLYAMCTGHAPFRASGTMAVMKRVIEDSPRSICEQHPEVPDWLEAIVFKLLAKNADDRFQQSKDLAQLLEQHLAHLQQPNAVAMPASVERPRERRPRRPAPAAKRSSFPKWLVAVIALIVLAPCALLFLAVGSWWLVGYSRDEPNNDTDRMTVVSHGPDGIVYNEMGPVGENELAKFQGDWECIAGEEKGKAAPAKEMTAFLGKATIVGDEWKINVRGQPVVAKISIDPSKNPKEIDFTLTTAPANMQGMRIRGIYQFAGNILNLCINPTGERPKDFVTRPESDMLVIVAQRLAATSQRDEDRLQGSWHAVGGEFAGEKLTERDMKISKITFTGERLSGTFPPKGLKGEGTFTINPTANPKQITVKDAVEFFMAMEGIYRFEGERLIICIAGGRDSRPKEFTSKGSNSCGVLVLERDPKDEGFVSLFNGKDLSGWKMNPKQLGNWQVDESGNLVGKGPADLSHLFTERNDFQDFHLKAEARINFRGEKGLFFGNSGIYFRCTNNLDRLGGRYPGGYEAQIFAGDTSAFSKEKETNRTGSLYNLKPYEKIVPGADAGEWFKMDVIAHGKRITIKVNDVTTVDEFEDAKFQRGHIGLQQAGAETVVQFRSIRIKELLADHKPPFALTPPKVLPHMVGAWSFEIDRQRTPDGKDLGKSTGLVVVEPVAGGEYFTIRTQSSDGGPSGLSIISLDKQAWRFKSRFFDPSGYVSDTSVGDFDANAKLLLMTNQTKDNLVLTRRQTFVDADTIQMKVTTHDKAGKVVFEGNGTMRRLPKGRAIDEAAVEVQQAPKELVQLDRLVGVWETEFTSRQSGKKWQAEVTGRKVLGGRFIETRERNLPSGEENYALSTYDSAARAYRQWYVSSRWPAAEGTGNWDEATKTLTWDCRGADESNPISTVLTERFLADDKTEFRVVVKDKDGKLLEDLVGTQTRRAKSK